jgi:hypothetical protein
MFRTIAFAFVVAIGLAGCSNRSGPPVDGLHPSPNSASPSPNDLRTCPRGVGCF